MTFADDKGDHGFVYFRSIFFCARKVLAFLIQKRYKISKNFLWEVNQWKILRSENPMKITSGQPKTGSSRNNGLRGMSNGSY